MDESTLKVCLAISFQIVKIRKLTFCAELELRYIYKRGNILEPILERSIATARHHISV